MNEIKKIIRFPLTENEIKSLLKFSFGYNYFSNKKKNKNSFDTAILKMQSILLEKYCNIKKIEPKILKGIFEKKIKKYSFEAKYESDFFSLEIKKK